MIAKMGSNTDNSDVWKNFIPRANTPSPKAEPESILDLSVIDSMDADALRNLIRTCYGVIAGYAVLSDEEKAEAARLKLYSLGMTSNEVHKVVPALDKWFDRTAGKAPQSVQMTVKQDNVKKLTDDELSALLALLPDPVIIPPVPKRIEE